MQKEWPRKQAQTKAAVRKARVVEERVLTEAKKKTKIAERVVQAAVKNATQANITATQAEDTANTVSKVREWWTL